MGRPKGARDRKPRRHVGQDLEEELDRLIAEARREAIEAQAQAATERAMAAAGVRPAAGAQRRPIDWNKAQVAIEAGHTDEEVAAILGVAVTTLVGDKVGVPATQRQIANAAMYRALKARYAWRGAASVRHFLWSVFRGRIVEQVEDERGQPITVRVQVPFAMRFQAAQILARQRQYLGFDQPAPPAPAPEPEPEPEPDYDVVEHARRVMAEIIEFEPERARVIRGLLEESAESSRRGDGQVRSATVRPWPRG